MRYLILLSMCLSFAYAKRCFVPVEKNTTLEKLQPPSEYCLEEVRIDLSYFSPSTAKVVFTIDGQRSVRTVQVQGKNTDKGIEIYFPVKKEYREDFCGQYENYEITHYLTLKDDLSFDMSDIHVGYSNTTAYEDCEPDSYSVRFYNLKEK